MSSQVAQAYNSRFAEGLDSYNNYMNSKDRSQISAGLGVASSKLDDGKQKLQAQITGLMNEGVAGLGIEGGGKMLASGLGKAGQFFNNNSFTSGADDLGEIAQRGLAQNRLAGQKQAVQEQIDRVGSPEAEADFNADRAARQTQAQSEVDNAQSQVDETSRQVQAQSDELNTASEQFQTEQAQTQGRVFDSTEDVSLSKGEVDSGNINVSSSYGNAEQTSLSEEGYYSRMESLAPKPTPFTQAQGQAQDPTTRAGNENVLNENTEEESFRPLNQGDPTPSLQANLDDTKSTLQTQTDTLAEKQTNLDNIKQESFADSQTAEKSALQDNMATLDASAGAEAGIDAGAEAGASALGVGLEAVGGLLDFGLPIAGLALGLAGIFESAKDTQDQQKKEAQAKAEQMNINNQTTFDESMIQTRDTSGSQALMANTDSAKFGSSAYAHF